MCKVCDQYGGPDAAAKALIAADGIEDSVDFGPADRVVLLKTKYGVSLYVMKDDKMGGMTLVMTEEGYDANVFPMMTADEIANES